jgi:hypothetical protein
MSRWQRNAQPLRQAGLLLGELLHLFAVLDLVYKDLGRLEAGDVVLINDDGRIAGNVAGNFFLALLVYKAPETTYINIMSTRHGILNDGKEGLDGCGNIGLVDSCLVRNLVDNVCFRHDSWVFDLF